MVYVYQKPKLKRADVNVTLLSGEDGAVKLNRSTTSPKKLGRVQSVETHGFEKNLMLGEGDPSSRLSSDSWNSAQGSTTKASVEVVFEDGFTVTVPAS